MNNQFDELAKGLAQSVTRRGALKKFGVGLVGVALASFGLLSKAHAANYKPSSSPCSRNDQCCSRFCMHSDPQGFGNPHKRWCA